MDKTIEQRAEEYAPNTITSHIFKSSPLKGLIVRILRDAYIAGAKDQEVIDNAGLYKLKERWEKEAQINHDRDKKSIKERAKLASEDYACDDRYSAGFFTGYVEGATKQQAIDEEVRLKKSDDMTEAEYDREMAFADWYLKNGKGTPTYSDAIEWARKQTINEACKLIEKALQKLTTYKDKDNFTENEFKIITASRIPNWLIKFRKEMEE